MRAEATGSSQGSRICIQLLQSWAGRGARLQSQSHLSRRCPAIETQRIIRTLILANERPPHVPRIHRVSRKAAGEKVETKRGASKSCQDSGVRAQPLRYFTSLIEKLSIVHDKWCNSFLFYFFFFKKKKRDLISHPGAALSSIVFGVEEALG